MKYLGQTFFIELVSPSIAGDPQIQNAASALDEQLLKKSRCISNVLLFARLAHDSGYIRPVPMLPPLERLAELAGGLQELPEPVLDLLAWQLHVEGYADAVDLQSKREMIWQSVMLHRKKGTPWAVRVACETAIKVETIISQWFEYGGKPYFFRVTMEITGVYFDYKKVEGSIKLILEHKNVRSWLEYLRTHTVEKLDEHVGIGASILNTAYFLPGDSDYAPDCEYRGIGARIFNHAKLSLVND